MQVVLSEIIQAVDRGDFAALVLLDLSAAFDTVDHEISAALTLRHKRSSPPMVSVVPGRPNPACPSHGSTISSAVHLAFGVLQGSVIGPILFVLYTADLIALVTHHEPWAVTAPLR